MSDDTIQPGKYVSLRYAILDEKGVIAEQAEKPLDFVYSSTTKLLGDMAQAIAGRRAGDELDFEVPPEKGFGLRDQSLVFTSKTDELPEELCVLGAAIQLQDGSGQMRSYIVSRVEDGELEIDGNHPLAGMNLTVQVIIDEVRDARPGEEQTTGIHAAKARGGSPSFN